MLSDNIRRLREELADKATLIAVSKTFPPAAVRAVAGEGIVDFGENYLREAEAKIAACADLPLKWHFVGALQSNKAKRVAELFDWAHGVDRLSVGERLSAARQGKPPMDIFMQVNVGGEATKSGVVAADAPALAAALAALPNLRLRGLMALPPPTDDEAAQHAAFRQVADLQAALVAGGAKLDCLSLGMSGDYRQALRVGATHVRLGTAIFGARPPKAP